ncbi:hypothetical protein WAI453_004300 [Rhynchosporium graminicola]
MTDAQGERIQGNCKIIWGDGDYDLDLETEDWVAFACVVKRDHGTSFGPPLAMTGLCDSAEQAWSELNRTLGVWAKQIQSGRPMTKAQSLEIFAGPKGRCKPVLEKLFDLMERKGIDS